MYSQLLFVLMCKWPSITTLILYYPSKVVFLSLVLRYFNTISLLSLYQYRTFSNHYQTWLFLRQSLPLLELVYYFYVQIRQATICDRGKPSMSILGTWHGVELNHWSKAFSSSAVLQSLKNQSLILQMAYQWIEATGFYTPASGEKKWLESHLHTQGYLLPKTIC